MIPLTQLMKFSNPQSSFLEDNLLDSNDWERSIPFDFVSETDSSPASSLCSDEFCYVERKTSPLQNDSIDTWFNNDNDFTTVVSAEQVDNSIFHDIVVKEEPLSPESSCDMPNSPSSLSSSGIYSSVPIVKCFKNQLADTENISHNIQSSLVETVPILATVDTKATALQQMVPVTLSTDNKFIVSDVLALAPLTSTQVSVAPQVPALRNGQFYMSNSMMKRPLTDTAIPQNTLAKAGVKRAPGMKIEDLLPPPKNIVELKNYKRQQRMIKNRESACLSRQRKKERLQSLEERVSKVTALNQQLKEENGLLKEKIQKLELENTLLRKNPAIMKNTAKKSTVLFAVVVCLVFLPYRFVDQKLGKPSSFIDPMQDLHHKSRSLLQFDNSHVDNTHITYSNQVLNRVDEHPIDYMENFFNSEVKINKEIPHLHRVKSKKEFLKMKVKSQTLMNVGDGDCNEHFNKTELNRINEALEGLAKGFAKKKLKSKVKKYQSQVPLDILQRNVTINKVETHNDNCNESRSIPKPPLSTQWKSIKNGKLRKVVQAKANKFDIARNQSQELFQAIEKSIRNRRKADTFYVISLMKDTFILPATSFNDTQRPKVSFMLPAYLPRHNGSSLNDLEEIPMLQIDCHVVDTTLLHLNRNSLTKKLLLT